MVYQGLSSTGVAPTLFAAVLDQVRADPDAVFEETFWPFAVLVEYDDPDQLVDLVDWLPRQLTLTVHGEPADPVAPRLLSALTGRGGRIVWDGWPIGVSVTWVMHHGGGWPATIASVHASVGPRGMRRFRTPVSLQDVPADLLPDAVRENNPWHTWRRIDGQLTDPRRKPGEGH